MKDIKRTEYVYFFKHNQTNGVKIGMSRSLDGVQKRFNSFKTYAPFGAKILGLIKTNDSLKLEQSLHKQYSNLRLNGEFFNIEDNIILQIIDKNDLEDQVKNEIKLAKDYTLKKILMLIRSDVASLDKNNVLINKIVNLFELDDSRNEILTTSLIIDAIKEKTNFVSSMGEVTKALKKLGFQSKLIRKQGKTLRAWNVKIIKH